MTGNPTGHDPEVLTLTQAALLVGVSDDRLKAEVEAGRLVARRIGRTWRFSRNASPGRSTHRIAVTSWVVALQSA
jgi:excisionase family DNA binding protein